jgi:hypothetical protein
MGIGTALAVDTGRLKTMLKFAFCILVSLLGTVNSSIAQVTAVASRNVDFAQTPLENIWIEVNGIRELFSRFSLSYDIPVGLEIARNENVWAVYRIDFKKGTLSDLLTQFVTEHNQYVWKIEDGVVSVFPKDDYRDPILRELLATEINSFSVKEKTSSWAFGSSLVSTPEIRRILERYGLTYDAGYLGGFYLQQLGQHFSLDVSKMRLKSILDKVIKESPVARNWIMRNISSEPTLFLRVNTKLEYSPASSEEPGEAQRIIP